MNIRNEVVMECVKNERSYRFCIPAGASFQDAHDVAVEIVSGIIQMSERANKQQQPAKEGEAIEPQV